MTSVVSSGIKVGVGPEVVETVGEGVDASIMEVASPSFVALVVAACSSSAVSVAAAGRRTGPSEVRAPPFSSSPAARRLSEETSRDMACRWRVGDVWRVAMLSRVPSLLYRNGRRFVERKLSWKGEESALLHHTRLFPRFHLQPLAIALRACSVNLQRRGI